MAVLSDAPNPEKSKPVKPFRLTSPASIQNFCICMKSFTHQQASFPFLLAYRCFVTLLTAFQPRGLAQASCSQKKSILVILGRAPQDGFGRETHDPCPKGGWQEYHCPASASAGSNGTTPFPTKKSNSKINVTSSSLHAQSHLRLLPWKFKAQVRNKPASLYCHKD